MALKKATTMSDTEAHLLIGVYPGTFDPITNGHLDIISRATKVVDKLVVGVAVNAGKEPLFTIGQRVQMCRAEIDALGSDIIRVPVEVLPFDKLLTEFVGDVDGRVIIRGLRAVSDFEYEIQMASINGRLNEDVETLFLMASETNQFISSRFVREIAHFGGDVTHFVPDRVAEQIKAAYKNET